MPLSRQLGAAAALTLTLCAAAPALARSVSVRIDEVTPVSLGAPAGHVVVGNPAIADVSMLDRNNLLILGRAYGVTNLIVTDPAGRTIYSAQVNVTPGEMGKASVFRGTDVFNYACASRCERQPLPGEVEDRVYKPFSQPVRDYAERAEKASDAGPSGGNP
jgi:hypothetical protein